MGADRSREIRARPSTAGSDAEVAPIRSPDAAVCSYRDGLLLASEQGLAPVVLDPISKTVWQALDGTTTLAALAEDLSDALDVPEGEALESVTRLIDGLAAAALVRWDGNGHAPIPRRLHQEVVSDSCIGQQLGLADSEVIRLVVQDGRGVTVGSNLPEVLAPLRRSPEWAAHSASPFGALPEPTYFIRGSRSASGRPRAHFLLDQMGNRLHLSWSTDAAADVLLRTSMGALQASPGVAVECLAFHGRRGAVLVHPALREVAIDAIRSMATVDRVELLPAVVVRLDGLKITAMGDPSLTAPLASVLAPAALDETARVQQLLHLALRWDDFHLRALRDLSTAVDVVEVDHTVTMDQLRVLIDRV